MGTGCNAPRVHYPLKVTFLILVSGQNWKRQQEDWCQDDDVDPPVRQHMFADIFGKSHFYHPSLQNVR